MTDEANAWAGPADAPSDPLLGTLLDRRYRIDALLGRGGMGAVYRGEQVFLHRPVAVKVLHPQFAGERELVERFRREAEISVRLQSPHVVEVLDFGETTDGRAYLVMELLAGESLQGRLRREGRLPPDEATRLLAELLRGLAAVHDGGIVHRDVKPDNLWLVPAADGAPRLKLLDFGIARMDVAGSATQLGLVMGTPEYLSPEQALGERVDHRADLYSVGVVAFVLLTGRHPFPGLDTQGLLRAHVTQPLPPLAEVRPELTAQPALSTLIARATVKDVAGRAASAAELLALLEAPASEAATHVAQRLRLTEPAPAGPAPPPPARTGDTAPTVASLAPGARVQAARLHGEAKELLKVTRGTLHDGARHAVSATLTSAFWLTRLLRWTLVLLGRALRALPPATAWLRRTALATAHRARGFVSTKRGRLVSALAFAAAVGAVVAVVGWWTAPANRARRALAEGQPALALTFLSDGDEADAEVQRLRGRALHAMNRPADGLAAYRAAAATRPGLWREPDVISDLVSALGGPRSKEVAELLTSVGDDAVAPLVRASTAAGSARTRRAAIELLKKLGHADRVDLVLVHIAELDSGDCAVITRAIRALAALGDSRAIAPLEEVATRRTLVFEACEVQAAREALYTLRKK